MTLSEAQVRTTIDVFIYNQLISLQIQARPPYRLNTPSKQTKSSLPVSPVPSLLHSSV